MTTRQRHRDPETTGAPSGAPAPATGRRELVEAANRLAAVADAAIDQCVSEDSERFLRANRQRGGQ